MNNELETKTYHGFEFRSIVIQNRVIPIVARNSKLVVYPSRFILFCIQQNNFTKKQASRALKGLVDFLIHLSSDMAVKGDCPDDLLCKPSYESIRRFISVTKKSSRKRKTKLLSDFFEWMNVKEEVVIEEKCMNYLTSLEHDISM